MHNTKLRTVISDILFDVGTPKPLQNIESMKIMADIIKFILTRNYSKITC